MVGLAPLCSGESRSRYQALRGGAIVSHLIAARIT
jgi:hypothetical protein